MERYEGQMLQGERALFDKHEIKIIACHFQNGESPLKEGSDIFVDSSTFSWKYPLWYCNNVVVKDSLFEIDARAGIWYTNNIEVSNTKFISPKMFRRCKGVSLVNVEFGNGEETLWECEDIHMKDIKSKGNYLLMNSKNIRVSNLVLNGNYPFDGCENVEITDSILNSKDAFWNCKNIIVRNCTIKGEYLGWNSQNVTFENCTIESLQGLCYMKNLIMRNCVLKNTTLAFEYSSLDVQINSSIGSVKNPSCGTIECKGIDELIMEDDKIDPSKTKFIYR